MKTIMHLIMAVFVFALFFGASPERSRAEYQSQYKKLLVKFPAFSLGAGEKIVGVRVTVRNGEIIYVFVPRGWSWRYSGLPVTEHMVHCFSPNPSYAITMTGRLPEISILDMSSVTRKSLAIEAAIQLEDSAGKEFTKQMEGSDLIIQ